MTKAQFLSEEDDPTPPEHAGPPIYSKEIPLFQCAQCPAAFGLGDDLRRHHAVAHGPTEKYVCTECGYFFDTVDNLSIHMLNIHSAGMGSDEVTVTKFL